MNVLPMKNIDSISMKEMLANAERQSNIIKEYKRNDLKALLTKKYWAMIEPMGEPDVEGDADVEALNAHRAAHVIRYAIDSSAASMTEELSVAIEREMKLSNLFSKFSQAKMEIIACIAKKPPEPEIDVVAIHIKKLKSLGWDMVRAMPDGTYIGLRMVERGPQLVTHLTELDYKIAYLYNSKKTAEKAFRTWDGTGDPYVNGGGWCMIVADAEHPKYEQLK